MSEISDIIYPLIFIVDYMDKPPQIKSLDENIESKEALYSKFKKGIKRLALLGVTFGGAFLSAQQTEAQEMKPGTVDSISMFYKMNDIESKKVIELSKEVDSLTRVLQTELKSKVPMTSIDEFINDKKVSSNNSYIYKNIQVGAEGSWDLSNTDDTLTNYNDVATYQGKKFEGGVWVFLADHPLNKMGRQNDKTKEATYFEGKGGDSFLVDYYTNKSGLENGGAKTLFDYGEKRWKLGDDVIQVNTQKDTEDVLHFNAETDSGKTLEYTLKKLKDGITVAITFIREEK